jgi:large subunit ribosomal protein L25
MSDIKLNLNIRTAEGKKVAVLRKNGIVPSVVYGEGVEPVKAQSSLSETMKVLRSVGYHTPLDVVIDGKSHLAIVKDVDNDPVKHVVRHVAFHLINKDDVITTEVPIVLTGIGESAAERAGLVILQAIDSIEIKARPADLPESLELSVLALETEDDKLTIADIKLPTGVSYDDVDQDLELVVANVYEPSALAAENDASGGEDKDVSEVASEKGSAEPVVEEAPADKK